MNINEIINNCKGIKNTYLKWYEWIWKMNQQLYIIEIKKYLEIKSKDTRYVKMYNICKHI